MYEATDFKLKIKYFYKRNNAQTSIKKGGVNEPMHRIVSADAVYVFLMRCRELIGFHYTHRQ
jgi:hypothetical protein